MHRLMVLSSAYRQDSRPAANPDGRRIDPDNRLLWRMNRRRLDLESMRDSLLAISGRLERSMGGRPADIAADPLHRRRTVYALVDRQSLPGLFRVFDFASPDASADRRPQTTVAQQALFGMNSPFMLEQARSLAGRTEIIREPDGARRVMLLYRRVLGREPGAADIQLALDFLTSAENTRRMPAKSSLDSWQQLAQVLLLTNELMFVD